MFDDGPSHPAFTEPPAGPHPSRLFAPVIADDRIVVSQLESGRPSPRQAGNVS
jgi:hypothetical protein